MRIFGRKREHQAGVVYAYQRNSHESPFYGATCNCGWFAEPVEADYPDPAVEEADGLRSPCPRSCGGHKRCVPNGRAAGDLTPTGCPPAYGSHSQPYGFR